MINVQQIANVLYNTLGLFALWFMVRCWRTYRTDKLRQDIFCLRSELFEYATTGAISVRHPSYRKLWSLLNSVLRFAHEISFVRLAVTLIWERARPMMPGIPNYMDDLRHADNLDSAAFHKLESIHQRLIGALVVQILFTSVFAFPALVLYCIYNVVRYGLPKMANLVSCETRQIIFDTRINYHIQMLEQQAIETRKINQQLQNDERVLTTA